MMMQVNDARFSQAKVTCDYSKSQVFPLRGNLMSDFSISMICNLESRERHLTYSVIILSFYQTLNITYYVLVKHPSTLLSSLTE